MAPGAMNTAEGGCATWSPSLLAGGGRGRLPVGWVVAGIGCFGVNSLQRTALTVGGRGPPGHVTVVTSSTIIQATGDKDGEEDIMRLLGY
jgi:hypothetical protein